MSAQIEKTKTQLLGYARYTLDAADMAVWAVSKWTMYSVCTIRGQALKIEFNMNGDIRVLFNDRTDIPLYYGKSIDDAVKAFNEELQ